MSTNAVWTEVKQEAREATRLYFAPFVGALRGAVKATQDVQRETREKRIERFKARQGLKKAPNTFQPKK